MKEWLDSLQPRERHLLLAGLIALTLMIFYLAVWQPISRHYTQLEQRVTQQRETLRWMEQMQPRILALRGASPPTVASGQSLLTVIDQTAKRNQLGSVVKRIEPAGQSTARVWVEQAQFDSLVLWFDMLQKNYGIRVHNITMEREAIPGSVSARITFEGSEG